MVVHKLSFYVVFCAVSVTSWSLPAVLGQDVQLTARHSPGTVSRVTMTLQVGGALRPPAANESDVDDTPADGPATGGNEAPPRTAVPLKVAGRLMYDEVLGPAHSQSDHASTSARYYHQAEAVLEVGGQSERIALPEDRRFVVTDVVEDPTLYSLDGPLTREQLDLIVTPGNSLLADRLLPGRVIRRGDRWTVDDKTIAGLLNWTDLGRGEVTSQLAELKNGLARVTMTGTVWGSVDGVESSVHLTGEFRFDVNWRRITWLSLDIRETRAAGPVHPGFEVNAELRMRMDPLEESGQLSAGMLQMAWKAHAPGQTFLTLQGPGSAFTMTHDRRWYVTRDLPRRTVLRCLSNGESLAQLNITQLARLPNGRELSLEAFQADVQDALGAGFREFVSARQDSTPWGYRVLRVEAAGLIAEVPIRWIYYHLSDSDGQRVAQVYSLQADKLESFGATDEEMVAGFRFEPATAASSQTAKKPARNRAG